MIKNSSNELEKQAVKLITELSANHPVGHDQNANCPRPQAQSTKEQSLLRTLIDNLPDFIFVKDCQSRFVISNRALARAFGAESPSQLVGKTDFDLFSPKVAEQNYADDQSIISSGQPLLDREQPFIDPAGNQRWLSTTKFPLLNGKGKVIGLVGMSRDITETKRTAEALKQRAAQLSLINEIGRQIAAVLELDKVLDRAADLVHETFGYHHVALFLYDGQEIKLKAVAGSYKKHFFPGCKLNLDQGIVGWVATRGGKVVANDVSVEARYVPSIPDQTVVTQAELCLPIQIAGQTQGVLDIQSPHRDTFTENDVIALEALTNQIAVAIENARLYEAIQQELIERKRVEEIQRESEEKYRALIEQSDDAIFLIYGNKFELVNPKFEELFGITLEDANAPGFAFNHIIAHNKNRVNVIGQANAGTEGKKLSPRYEFTALDKDGNEIEVELSVSYPTYRGGLATQGVLRDITERKRAERALTEERALLARRVEERTAELSAANAELARAARLKDEFLASMSHELRTPLNGILGISELLQEEIYGSLNEKQLKSLQSIEESGRHLLALINDILDLSKIEADKLEMQMEAIPVESICQASLRIIKQMARRKKQEVSVQFDSNVTVLQADGRRLKQILVNLLSNAVKFTPEGGSVGLEVRGDVEQEVVHFTVWDTGIGISTEDMGRLFQSFVQIDSSLSRQHAGTGLGLALVRRLTELHGGGVSLESEVGQGSQFTVSLPWHIPKKAVEPTPEKSAPANMVSQSTETKSALILLVEDNETNITAFSDFLKATGYQVVVARNGHEAIERTREDRPDLIVMDIQMPGMDGLEATRRLRADGKLASIPIIALTALAMPGDRERCLAAGADDYLAKPVSYRELIDVIKSYLQKSIV